MDATDQSSPIQPSPAQASPAPVKKGNGMLIMLLGLVVVIIVVAGAFLYLNQVKYPSSVSTSSSSSSSSKSTYNSSTYNAVSNGTSGSSSSVNYVSPNYRGHANCTSSGSQYNCNSTQANVDNNPAYFGNNTVSESINGTYVSGIWMSQDTGVTWNNVSIAFVPEGTAVSASGVPEVYFNFTHADMLLSSMSSQTSDLSALIINLPISPSRYGVFNGKLWARYHINGSSAWQYADMATLNVTSANATT